MRIHLILSSIIALAILALPAIAEEKAKDAKDEKTAEEAKPAEAEKVTLRPGEGSIKSKLSEDELKRILAGEIILRSKADEETTSGAGSAIGMMKATPRQIWTTILNYDKYAEFMPRVEYCKTTLRRADRIDSEFKLDMGLTTIEYSIIHYLHPKENRLTWKLDKDKKAEYITRTDGFWQLDPIDGERTLLEYNTEVDIDIPFIGGLVKGLVKKLTHDDLPNVVETLRKRIESKETWTKD